VYTKGRILRRAKDHTVKVGITAKRHYCADCGKPIQYDLCVKKVDGIHTLSVKHIDCYERGRIKRKTKSILYAKNRERRLELERRIKSYKPKPVNYNLPPLI
jgi:hypothetical protein